MSSHKVIDNQGQEIHSAEPIHPGEMLIDELEARDISQKDFANQLGMRASHLNELLKGKRNFTAQIALKVESALGIGASFWMRAQGEYFLDVARLERSEMETLETV